MTVRELIELLSREDPEAIIEVWDPYYDRETQTVHVSLMKGGKVMISNTDFTPRGVWQ